MTVLVTKGGVIQKLKTIAFAMFIGASTGLIIPSAWAATLTTSGGFLTGATGVSVTTAGGDFLGIFDVSFASPGSCFDLYDGCDGPEDFDFNTATDSLAAAQALLDQVFIDDFPALGLFDSDPGKTFGCKPDTGVCDVVIPYAFRDDRLPTFDNIISIVDAFNNLNEDGDFIRDNSAIFFRFDSTGPVHGFTFARFSPAPIPIPAALPLFLTAIAGLGGLSFMRRRKAA